MVIKHRGNVNVLMGFKDLNVIARKNVSMEDFAMMKNVCVCQGLLVIDVNKRLKIK